MVFLSSIDHHVGRKHRAEGKFGTRDQIVALSQQRRKMDPSEFLPSEIFLQIFSHLDIVDVGRCILEDTGLMTDSKRCARVASSWLSAALDNEYWRRKCEQLWHDKVYVPQK